ncbi:hypothetical protein [Robiginitomaculum antarcticum]|uniref:hypothetical protein n=1 Tax=Robiginitomaculum antarcticum TaxID=437507 RepID=UPI00037936E9|nr:hypothetical protein [Robiginitomaculum antarcticum]
MRFKFISAIAIAVSLPACATTVPVMQTEHSAVAHNIAAQSIEPSAAQKANINIPEDPTLRAAARERYRQGNVTEPKTQDTR